MKHLKIILLLLLGMIGTQTMYAYDFMVNGLCYNKNSDGTSVTVTYQKTLSPRYTNLSDLLNIPTNVTYGGKSYSVTAIGNNAFYGCSGLTSVSIPNSVTTIGNNAFKSCTGLTSVTIPNSVTAIGSNAFWGCSGLTSVNITDLASWCGISFGSENANPLCDAHHLYLSGQEVTNLVIPNSVTSIGNYAFYGCSGLTSVSIPNSVTAIGNSAFDGCNGLTSVTIPNSVTTIGSNAFWVCSGLTSVTIPNSVTTIGSNAFWGCKKLTSVTIPNSVTSIGSNAFGYCTGLTEVHISDITAWCIIRFGDSDANPLRFAHHLYLNGQEVTDLVIPNSVTLISTYAFYRCTGLTSVTIGNSVTSIGSSAFSGCSGLTSVSIPNSVTSIGSSAFSGCSGLTSVTIPNSVTYIGSSTFYYCDGLTSVTIPNSVTSIGSNAFEYCSRLKSLTIPNSVTTIGNNAFYGCSGLKKLRIEDGTTDLTMTTSSSYTPFDYCPLDTLYIGRNITPTDSSYPPFKGNTNIKYLTIGTPVTAIGVSAFKGCTGLTSVIWNAENCTNFSSASVAPFEGLTTITSFIFGNEVKHIPAYLCYGLSGLTSVSIPNSVSSIGSSAFSGCSGLTSVAWDAKNHTDFSSSDAAPFKDLTTIISFIFGNEVKHIPAYLCYGLSGLTSVSIPNSVSSIGSSAFFGCSGLTSVSIPNSVSSIGSYAFLGCSGLTSVTIPNSVSTIGDYAFKGCSGLTSVTIPNSVTSIGSSTFYNCNGLTSVTIPNSVTSIGSNAFGYCSRLKSLTIPNSVTTIGNWAFYSCSGLKKLRIEDGTTDLTMTTSSSSTPFQNCPLDTLYIGRNITPTNSSYLPFKGNTNIKYLTIGTPVTAIGVSAFKGCNGLTRVTWNAENCTDFSTSDKAPFKDLTTITSFIFGNEVKHIPAYLSYGLSGLTSVTIPNSVTTIGNWAFQGCTGLTSVNITDLASWCGISFGSENANPLCDAHHLYLSGQEVTNLVIPNSVTSIGNYAFYGCSGLTSVTIPNSVSTIGSYAFDGCSSLTSVTIPNSVTSIGSHAFEYCTGLTSVTISNSLTSISQSVFKNCSGLTSVAIPNSVIAIDKYAFENCSGLTSVTIPNSVSSIGDYAFKACSGLGTIYCEIPEPLTISANVFSNYNATLFVFDSYDKYMATSPWNKFNVLLDERYISSLQFASSKITISTGETKQLSVSIVPDYYNNDKTMNWATSDETVVSVDANGQVRGVGAGTALITATSNGKNYQGSNVSASCAVQVMYPSEGAGTGDVNEDGKIDITDATLIISYLQGNTPSAVHDESLMDVTGDGDINMSDVLKVISLIRND